MSLHGTLLRTMIFLPMTAYTQEWGKFGSIYYHLVQNHLPFHLLCVNMKIKINRTIILSDVLNGCEAWPYLLKEEHKWWVFENEMVRRIFGSKGRKSQKAGQNSIIMGSLIHMSCQDY